MKKGLIYTFAVQFVMLTAAVALTVLFSILKAGEAAETGFLFSRYFLTETGWNVFAVFALTTIVSKLNYGYRIQTVYRISLEAVTVFVFAAYLLLCLLSYLRIIPVNIFNWIGILLIIFYLVGFLSFLFKKNSMIKR